MESREPQHLEMYDKKVPWYRWDWRKENPGEVILIVFGLAIFAFFPRVGCGVTSEATASSDASAPAVEKVVESPTGKPQG